MPPDRPARIHSRSRGSSRAYFDTAASLGSRNHTARPGSSSILTSRSSRASRQRRNPGRHRVEVIAVACLEGAALPQRVSQLEHARRVRLAPGIHIDRHRHARGHLAGVAERGEAADDHIVGFAVERARFAEEPTQIVTRHVAAGGRAKLQGVFCNSASVHASYSSSARATLRAGPDNFVRQREM